MFNQIPRYEAIFLDADGTLLDFNKSQRTALRKVLTQYNYPWNEEINQVFAEENERVWQQYEQNLLTREDVHKQRFSRFFQRVGMKNCPNIEEINQMYISLMAQSGSLLEGAYTLCETLSKHTDIYITTNGMHSAKTGVLKKSGLEPFVKDMFVSDVVGYQKPAAQYFEYIFQKERITDKSKVIILGDSLTADMQGGRNAGIATCLFDPQNKIRLPHPLCDHKITALTQFLDIVFS